MTGCGKGVWLPYAECYSPCGHGGEFCDECMAEFDSLFRAAAHPSGGPSDTPEATE